MTDSSQTYTKMCDCPEIRAALPTEGLFCFTVDHHTHYFCSNGDTFAVSKDGVYTPRQDQLQGMVEYVGGLQSLTWVIHDFSESEYGSRFTISGTMEQLWLALVMKEKHGKVWTGDTWASA